MAHSNLWFCPARFQSLLAKLLRVSKRPDVPPSFEEGTQDRKVEPACSAALQAKLGSHITLRAGGLSCCQP